MRRVGARLDKKDEQKDGDGRLAANRITKHKHGLLVMN